MHALYGKVGTFQEPQPKEEVDYLADLESLEVLSFYHPIMSSSVLSPRCHDLASRYSLLKSMEFPQPRSPDYVKNSEPEITGETCFQRSEHAGLMMDP